MIHLADAICFHQYRTLVVVSIGNTDIDDAELQNHQHDTQCQRLLLVVDNVFKCEKGRPTRAKKQVQ